MATDLQQGFQLGDWKVRPSDNEIVGPDGPVRLAPRAMKVLVALAEADDGVISRRRLARLAWGEDNENTKAMTAAISRLRQVLGDTAEDPRYIRTVPRRGYELVAEVKTEAEIPAPAMRAAAITPPPATSHSRLSRFFDELRRRKVIRAASAYVVVGWLVIEVASVIVPTFVPEIADEAVKFVIILITLGFPIAVFMAWVFQVTPEGIVVHDGAATSPVTRRGRRIDYALLGLMTLTIGFVVWRTQFYEAPVVVKLPEEGPDLIDVTPEVAPNSIAVLAFRSIGPGEEGEYFGDGLAEEILNLLAKLRELKVSSRTASFYFKNRSEPWEVIADRLRVRFILDGSVRRDGDRVRITAQLIDAQSGLMMWNETYNREFNDIFDIQNDIARDVLRNSRMLVSRESEAVFERRTVPNPVAYDFYLQGRDILNQPGEADRLDAAAELFGRALGLEPEYPEALAGLCETHIARYERTRNSDAVGMAERACREALDLDPGLVQVHAALGSLYRISGQNDLAEESYRAAMELNPNRANDYIGLAKVLNAQNRVPEAEKLLLESIKIEPGSWRGYSMLAGFYYRHGREREALPYVVKVTELTPDNARAFNNLGAVYFGLGRLEESTDAYRRALDIEPSRSAYSNLGLNFYYLRQFDDAVKMFFEAIEIAPKDYRVWGNLGGAYRFLGNNSEASKDAFRQGMKLAEEALAVNPEDWDALKNIGLFYIRLGRADEAYDAILKAMELAPQDADVHFFAALIYLADDRAEDALAAIERALELDYARIIIDNEPEFDAIRADQRFMDLMASVHTG